MPNKRYIKPEHREYESVASIIARGVHRGIIGNTPETCPLENKRAVRRALKRSVDRRTRVRAMRKYHSGPGATAPRPREKSRREMAFLERKARREARAEIAA